MHAYLTRFDKLFGLLVSKLPSWLTPFMLAVTMIGQPAVLIVVALAIAAVSLMEHKPRIVMAAMLALSAFAGNTLLKHLLHRTRPDTLYVQHMKIQSFSFPSGHAFGSIVVYGLLAYLVATHLPAPWNYLITAMIIVLIVLIGISRVYLGAHFPSDVLVGWVLGGLSLMFIIYFVKP